MPDTQAILSRDAQTALSEIKEHGSASVSFLQRKLVIGYNKASGLIEELEDAGLISRADHAGKRDLLFSRQPDASEQFSEIAFGDKNKVAGLTEAAREKLRQTVARIERLEEEKAEVANQIKEVYGEAKALGYDTKALRSLIRIRKTDRAEREEQEAILGVYLLALGEI